MKDLAQASASSGEAPPEPVRVEEGAPQPYAENRVLSWLFDTRVPAWKYIVRAGLISLVPSLVVSTFLALVGLGNEETLPQFGQEMGPAFLLVNMIIVAPVLETLLLALGLWLLSFVTRNPLRQALGSCLLWAALHSSAALAWGPVVIWPFFVFSSAYLAWRRRSRWHAMGVTCGIHMFQNFLPGILIVVAGVG